MGKAAKCPGNGPILTSQPSKPASSAGGHVEPLEPGDPSWVGQYQIQGRLGSGGMGRVFLAKTPGNRKVAVKLIRPELAQDHDFRIRFARDVAAAKEGKGLRAPAAAPGGAPAIAPAMSDQQIRSLYEEGSYELIPHDGMRRTIAQRLTASTQTIPHFYLTIDCDIGKLVAAREEINATAPKDKDGKPAYKLSVNDFVIKALALALQRVPDANVSWTDAGMLKHKHSDIGVAVAMPNGLITPRSPAN